MQNTRGKELGASPEWQCCAVHFLCSELDEAPNSPWQTWDAFVRQEEAGHASSHSLAADMTQTLKCHQLGGPHSRETTPVMVP